MTLRITTRRRQGKTVVQVDGKLTGDEVRALEETCRRARLPLALDLANLETADETGLRLLRALAAAGAVLRDTSPYVALLLEGGGGP